MPKKPGSPDASTQTAPTLGVPSADGVDDVGERTDQLERSPGLVRPTAGRAEPGQVTGRADQDVGTGDRVAGRRPEDLAPDAPDELDGWRGSGTVGSIATAARNRVA